MGYQTAWEGVFKEALHALHLPHNHAYLVGWKQASAMWKVRTGRPAAGWGGGWGGVRAGDFSPQKSQTPAGSSGSAHASAAYLAATAAEV